MGSIILKKIFLGGSAFSDPQTEGVFLEDGKSASNGDYGFKLEKYRFLINNLL